VRERETRKERERREAKQGGGKKEREQKKEKLTTASVSTRMSPKCALVTMICNS